MIEKATLHIQWSLKRELSNSRSVEVSTSILLASSGGCFIVIYMNASGVIFVWGVEKPSRRKAVLWYFKC